jgi:hypothetical protein
MRPVPKDTNAEPPRVEHRQTTEVNGNNAPQNAPPRPARPLHPAAESRLNERLGRLLRQRKGPDAVMLGVLSVALFCGLVGFAVHFLWIVAVIVLALGLGFIIADSRRDRIDIANQRSEKADSDAP